MKPTTNKAHEQRTRTNKMRRMMRHYRSHPNDRDCVGVLSWEFGINVAVQPVNRKGLKALAITKLCRAAGMRT